MIPEKILKKDLDNYHFVRYAMYLDIIQFVKKEFHAKKIAKPKIVEFGSSNGFICKIFNHPSYEVAENYPKTDIQDLKSYEDGSYDFVIMDQVLEHVPNPNKAIKEIQRILKKGGWLICTTPFLIQVHFSPNDYWRFSKEGMKELLSCFSESQIKSWGNKGTVLFHLLLGCWPCTKKTKILKWFTLGFFFSLKNDENYPYMIWSYAKK